MDEITPLTGEGFYDSDGNYAPNFVSAADYELLKEDKDTYTYPFNGWVWAENAKLAQTIFELQASAS